MAESLNTISTKSKPNTKKIQIYIRVIRKIMPFVIFTLSSKTLLNFCFLPLKEILRTKFLESERKLLKGHKVIFTKHG